MVPRKFNIVEFDGFDLAGQYGEALPGIYDKIVDAHWNCVYIMCFGLKFAGFDIAPQYMTPEMFSDHIMLNGIISIDQNDVITIPSILPPTPPPIPPVIQALTATENRVYEVPEGVDGFAPVTVNVSGGDDWSGLKNYIESSGTQYIDTGYFPNDRTNVEVVASVSRGTNQYPTIFGMRPQTYSSSGTHDLLIHFYSSSERATLFQRNIGVATSDYTKYVDKKAKYFLGAGGFAVESESYTLKNFSPLAGTISSSYSLYIFNFNYMGAIFGTSAACVMKLYRMRIFEGDSLIHEFIPWQENDVACLKDTVTDNLLYNAGTGSFVYGTDA